MLNWIFRIAPALAEGAEAIDGVEDVSPVAALLQMILPLALIFAAMYFIMIRPQRKKDKKVKEMLGNLKVTDRVTTIGGIHGTITGIKDQDVILTVGKDNVQLNMARWAIRSIDDETLENDAEALN
jgi:preprotein translocase subunit YajC